MGAERDCSNVPLAGSDQRAAQVDGSDGDPPGFVQLHGVLDDVGEPDRSHVLRVQRSQVREREVVGYEYVEHAIDLRVRLGELLGDLAEGREPVVGDGLRLVVELEPVGCRAALADHALHAVEHPRGDAFEVPPNEEGGVRLDHDRVQIRFDVLGDVLCRLLRALHVAAVGRVDGKPRKMRIDACRELQQPLRTELVEGFTILALLALAVTNDPDINCFANHGKLRT